MRAGSMVMAPLRLLSQDSWTLPPPRSMAMPVMLEKELATPRAPMRPSSSLGSSSTVQPVWDSMVWR